MAEINFSKKWSVVTASDHPICRLAKAELIEILNQITVGMVVEEGQSADSQIVLDAGPKNNDENYSIQVNPNSIQIRGSSPRGLLFGVYAFLESLGCSWTSPGIAGEHYPKGEHFIIPDGISVKPPAFAGRCLILGHHAFLEQGKDWIIWAARNRLNTIFIHTIDGPLAFGAAPIRQWERKRGDLLPLAHERGMTIELGGHGLSDLVPRRMFKNNPALFRMKAGKRTPDHNFCPSNAQVKTIFQQNVRRWIEKFPEADVYHIWADDIVGGGWCECSSCQGYSSSDQLLMAVNWVGEVLAEVKPGAQVSFLAYHDTENPPEQVHPLPNVCLLWAPRMRCYGHSLDDPACPQNGVHYPEKVARNIALFREANASPARVFEYYLDGILFKSVLPPIFHVMQRDLQFYHQAGVHTVQSLMTGDHPWINSQVNAWMFARLSWNPDQNLEDLLSLYVQQRFGKDATEWQIYYQNLEKAFTLALDIHPEQVHLAFDDSLRELLDNPPADMGDPSYAPLEVLKQKVEGNQSIMDYLGMAERSLLTVAASSDREEWRRELEAFNLVKGWLRFDHYRLVLVKAVQENQPSTTLWMHWRKAESAYQEVMKWGKEHISDRRYRLNFKILHTMFWFSRLAHIRSNHLSGTITRRLRRLGWVLQLLLTFRRMQGLYR
ncbi:MAG TPA: DUF4838 domain-containing protein [Anaerolineaceae bacterium]